MEEFRSVILKEVREIITREEQHEVSMKSWNGSETKGFELVFEGTKRAVPLISGVIGQIFITFDGGFEAIITGYVLKSNLRSIVSSFSITPSSSLPTQLATGLSSLVLAVASTLTINHLLMISDIRDKILGTLTPNNVGRLCQTSKTVNQTLTSTAVDRTYWKEHLKNEFGAEKVRETIAKGRTFHGVYCEMKASQRRNSGNQNPLLVGVHDPLMIPPNRGLGQPWNPLIRQDPDAEFFNPLGDPFPPGFRGDRNPQNPFLGQNHPDLNPLGGGLQREIFGPPRGGMGNQGRPFMRGNGGFGGGNDFI